jgi:excisionase family DNA binding protein
MAPQLSRVIERLTLPPSPRTLAVTVRHAARLLDCSESTIKRLIRANQVRSQRVRGRRLVALDSLQSLLSR